MKAALITLLCSGLWLWPAGLYAQSDKLMQAFRQYQELNKQGRYKEAEPFAQRALELGKQELGPEHRSTAALLSNLALLYDTQGRYADAEPLHKRSLAIWEKALGPDHPDVARSLNNLASLYHTQGRYADAEPLYKRSLAINEKALGPGHPDVALSLNNLAHLYRAQGQIILALDHIRRSSAIHRGRTERTGGRSDGRLSEQKTVRHVFTSHVANAIDVAEAEPSKSPALTAEAFEAGQLANASSTAAAVAGMAARFGAGDDALGRLVRTEQDAAEEWRRVDKRLIDAVSKPPAERNPEVEARLRARLVELNRQLAQHDADLHEKFPDYAELASPRAVAISKVQQLLSVDEAFLTYVVGREHTFLWVLRRDRAEMHRLDIGGEALTEAVADQRLLLDPTGMRSIPEFDTTEAFELYEKLFAPAEPLLDGVRHVFVVPDGALQSLPLGVLVTKEPQGKFTDFADYRQVSWLAKKYALTTLPSVSSLRALRRFAKAAKATKPFLGIGDPLLEGHPDEGRGTVLASLFTSRGIADVGAVRLLPALPDTADELMALAKSLGADEQSLLLRNKAREPMIRKMDMTDYKVVAFATHGLVSGDLKGLSEPALVLTPPDEGTEEDDGLLTASEIATLKLDADWVILSACNTASTDGTPGADGLSGLAKAFFYAGSRTLLVSHWPVASEAAVKLTTTMLEYAAAHPEAGRAEALRQSMLELMNDEEKPEFAHPLFWAPFVVVGEGGIYAAN
jgi:CHAT domain-containing protein